MRQLPAQRKHLCSGRSRRRDDRQRHQRRLGCLIAARVPPTPRSRRTPSRPSLASTSTTTMTTTGGGPIFLAPRATSAATPPPIGNAARVQGRRTPSKRNIVKPATTERAGGGAQAAVASSRPSPRHSSAFPYSAQSFAVSSSRVLRDSKGWIEKLGGWGTRGGMVGQGWTGGVTHKDWREHWGLRVAGLRSTIATATTKQRQQQPTASSVVL